MPAFAAVAAASSMSLPVSASRCSTDPLKFATAEATTTLRGNESARLVNCRDGLLLRLLAADAPGPETMATAVASHRANEVCRNLKNRTMTLLSSKSNARES